jgi:hypothetical protein
MYKDLDFKQINLEGVTLESDQGPDETPPPPEEFPSEA